MSGPVAIVTCAGGTPGADVDPDSRTMLAALRQEGLDAELVVWDDPSVDWDRHELNVIRSTWDYVGKLDAFARWVATTPRLANPAPVVQFSLDKHYLAELSRRGVDVVATEFVDVGATATFPSGDFVVKPAVGAGSMQAERYSAGDHEAALAHVAALHDRGRDVMVQPYVASVDSEGECALIFIGGEFSHAMNKSAMLNVAEPDRHALFRMEQMSRREVSAELVGVGESVLAAAGFGDLLYARVDVVREGNSWLLMELELIEPSLFLAFEPAAPIRLARGIARRMVPSLEHRRDPH